MLIDTHAHLDMRDYDKDRKEVIHRAVQGGVSQMITVGIDEGSSQDAVKLATQHGSVYAAIGCHPHHAKDMLLPQIQKMATLASDPQVVAWGEIGLDFYRGYSSPEVQRPVFEFQVHLAHDLRLPIIVHDREAHEEVYETLKKMGRGALKGVIHCFSGDVTLALAFVELGYFISIPGTVTYPKASLVRDVATDLPLDRLLIETDAPFLSPAPFRGKRNEPLYVQQTAREIARLRNIPFEEVGRVTTDNARSLFGI